MKQKTLKDKIIFEGIGVHSGDYSQVVLYPGQENSGIYFINPNFKDIKIEIGRIVPEKAMYASVLKKENFAISTIEHLMATINAFHIDNLVVEIKGLEVPILDGSSSLFVHEIERVGIIEQMADKKFLTPLKPLKFIEKDEKFIEILPAKLEEKSEKHDSKLYFEYFSDFNHPLIGQNYLSGILTSKFFKDNISPARTFGFLEQLPFLRQHGLAQGTSLGNTVVIGEEEFLNELRFKDEFVRHKLLDLIGDLALLGKNLAGKIIAKKTGHSFNRQVIKHYIENPNEWHFI